MTFVRASWLVVAFALLLEGCSCGRAPVNTLLKQEGEACAADDECESVLCDQLPGKPKVCFRKCATGCKSGDVCTSLAVGDRYVCVPEKPGLCQGCELNTDCPYPGDRCVEIGGQKVCARDCAFDGQCPPSYRCADATDSTGAYAPKQCQPTSGTCECIASTAGQTVPCSETNNTGTCTGVKTCRPPNGYDACSAPVPTTESCNGRDDDCNGMTDENLGDTECGVGECKRAVSNCINGSPQRCEPGTPTTELCDGKDNDCNGTADDGIDKMTSLAHCGACNSPCALPNAVPVCAQGQCGIAQCLPGWTNADGLLSNGCEYPCTRTNSGVEACDGVDNNCDGRTDEGYTLATDPTNCGVCGRVCNVNNGNVATYACIGGQCAIATCVQAPTKYDDCDQTYATGCEKNVSNDVNNCGGCNLVCTGINGTATCTGGACGITCTGPFANCDNQLTNGCEVNTNTDVDHCGACPTACPNRTNATRTCTLGGCGFSCTTGFVDLDGVAANGCEYTCTATGADDPDDQSLDQNCDGLDGDESRAIFVAKTGNNLNPGTRALPKLTVQAGINAASSARPHVYVSTGFYDEAITLSNGISLFGGYSATANWARGPANVVTLRNGTVSGGRVVTVAGSGLTSPTTLAYLTIRALDTATAGASTYALHCVGCTALTVRSTVILAGAGGTGSNGASPAGTAGGGSIGDPGTNGSCDGSNGSGGTGGASACSRTGGKGGDGAYARNTGQTGGIGVSGTLGGSGGSGGGDCGSFCTSSCTKGQPGIKGDDGASGTNGTHGTGGGAAGTITLNFFVSSGGGNGVTGGHGNGGGGGGGGGGQGGGCVNDGGGNGGGGGGGGGCGGAFGSGGGGGGSSFGVFLVNSNGAAFQSCDISSANGGNGGNGGGGQSGGPGAGGGAGQTACTDEVGRGGDGGAGGAGGNGGHGGGGAGGASYALYKVNSTPTLTSVTLTAGNGGLGGSSPAGGASMGASGMAGQQN